MPILTNAHRFAGTQYRIRVWTPGEPVLICTSPVCGVDSETELIENEYTRPPVVAAGFWTRGQCDIVSWENLNEYLELFLAANPTVKLAFFNIHFDITVMGREILLKELNKEGRMMELKTNYRIHEVGTKGWFPDSITLAEVTKKTLAVELNKTDGTRVSFRRGQPLTDKQIIYLSEDCAATGMCGEIYNGVPTETIQARASFVLSEIALVGIKADPDALEEQRRIQVEKMAKLGPVLRSFGYRLKSKQEDKTQLLRFSDICEAFGVAEVDKRMTGIDRKLPATAPWILLANLLNTIINNNRLPSDFHEVTSEVVGPLLHPDVDWSSKNKGLKEIFNNAREFVKAYLDPLGCGDCCPEVRPKTVVPLFLLEAMVQLYTSGELLQEDGLDKLNAEFKQLYEENMGWLPNTAPLSCTAFIQQRLRKLLQAYPDLELPLTESSEKNLRQYLTSCRAANQLPDPETQDKLTKYACKRDEMWRMVDAGVDDPFLNAYTEYKHAEKLLSTYLKPELIAEDGRVHTKFNDFLITGRTSSSGPNIQNVPKEPGLREVYCAPPGKVLCSTDYSQEELVTLAATLQVMFGKSRMADAVNAGLCLHSLFALYRDHKLEDIDLANMMDPEVIKIIKERSKPYKEDKVLKKHRQLSKMANFGLGADMCAKTFYANCRKQGAELTLPEAEQLRSDWFNMWPEMNSYVQPIPYGVKDISKLDKKSKLLQEIEDEELSITKGELELEVQQMVNTYQATNLLGIRRVDATKQAALNFNFQSLAAVVSKRALWLVFLDSEEHGYKLVNFIHDEIISELDEATAAVDAERIGKLMVQAGKDVIPHMFMRAEPCLMYRWSKDAEPRFNSDGVLIPSDAPEEA